MQNNTKQFMEDAVNPYAKVRKTYLLPAYLVLTALFFVGFIIASMPDDQPGIFGISCLILWGIVTVLILLSLPLFRKKEIRWELTQYSFDWENLPDQPTYFYQGKKNYVRFFPTQLSHNDVVYSYDEIRFSILTYNWKQHVLIYLHYEFEGGRWRVPLSAEILHMIYQFDLELENPDDLAYIVQNPNEAFQKIYNGGTIHGIRHYISQPSLLPE